MTSAADLRANLLDMMATKGAGLYGGEAITQEAHALQAAALAEHDGQAAHVIVAALLHDIGHLYEPGFAEALDKAADGRHEMIGQALLKRWFGPNVTEPVRLHVAAKRYLCATRPHYFATLSPASVRSLALQGGPMSADEVARFEAEPHWRDAVQVRLYDDLAKDPEMVTPDLAHFLPYVEAETRQAI